ncbi:hypothetical protein IU470_13775 [Nocardia abscessus]|uniref:Uncharacterized protein n=1 Tax=Nocardia abscessus TaxID=120957 RepID=A0ABS0C713_9NOCA|nr:hypothetical protein [Nocardia abscessus]MBF6226162.1 hypothetical protein [Nocardia abscessus]
MSKVDDAVDKINKHYESSTWDGAGFQDGQAEDSLKALSGLNSTEFKEAFDRLEPAVREMLARDTSSDLAKRNEYRDIVDALKTGNPQHVVDAKKTKEDEAATPKYADGYGWELPDEKEHLFRVDLYQPKGASAALISLIEDTEFTMQWGFDTLGVRDPKAAPDFTNVLDGQQVTTADGWSQVRSKHETLKEQLSKRQTEYSDAHKNVNGDTNDTAILNSEVFGNLKKIMEGLNEKLQFAFPGAKVVDGKMEYSFKDADNSMTKIVAYEKNQDSGNYFLTAEAEQSYYVRHIDAAAEKWDTEYENATKQFQKKAADVDNQNNNNNNNNANNNNNNNNNNNANNNNANNGNTYVPPAGDPSTQPSGTTNDDWSSTYDDLLGGSTDTDGSLTDTGTGTGAQLISDTGTTDATTSSDPLAAIRSALTGAGTGTGAGTSTGANTGSVAPPANAAGDNGMANAMQQMAMMNAMSGMMNQGNRQPDDDRLERAYAERDREREREKREERERNRNAQATTATQAVQQTSPPGVTAPTYAGAPPAVTTPGGMVDYKIGNSTVQVPPPVAEALQRQTQNTATNAVAAYEGTAGASTADHPWATVNDVAQLKTGDVVQWEKHSALIVKNENGLNILDNGQLIPLDPNNPPLTEKYGSFTGYAHPTGLDVGSNTADPTATAPPPPTVSATQPAGPPPVGPPPQV